MLREVMCSHSILAPLQHSLASTAPSRLYSIFSPLQHLLASTAPSRLYTALDSSVCLFCFPVLLQTLVALAQFGTVRKEEQAQAQAAIEGFGFLQEVRTVLACGHADSWIDFRNRGWLWSPESGVRT